MKIKKTFIFFSNKRKINDAIDTKDKEIDEM